MKVNVFAFLALLIVSCGTAPSEPAPPDPVAVAFEMECEQVRCYQADSVSVTMNGSAAVTLCWWTCADYEGERRQVLTEFVQVPGACARQAALAVEPCQ